MSPMLRALGAATFAALAAAPTLAGDLTPPAGPVAPSMVTLNEIFNAVGGSETESGPNRVAIMKIQGVPGESPSIGSGADPNGAPAGFIPITSLSGGNLIVMGGASPQVQPMQIVTPIELSTPELMQLAIGFTAIPTIDIEIREETSPGQFPLRALITLKNCRISAAAPHYTNGSIQYTVNAGSQISVTYFLFDENGPTGDSVTFCYSIQFNTAC